MCLSLLFDLSITLSIGYGTCLSLFASSFLLLGLYDVTNHLELLMGGHAVNDVLHIAALHRAQNLWSFPVIEIGFRLSIFFVRVSILGFRLKTLLERFESLSVFLSSLFKTFRSISISLLIGEPSLVDMPDGPRP